MIPDYIMNFIKEIAPNHEELYLSCFNEKTCIVDATELIRELKAEIKRKDEAMKQALKLLRKWNDSLALEILEQATSEVKDNE